MQGTVFSTGGDQSWPVTYRITTTEAAGGRSLVSGTIDFAAGTRLRTLNPSLPLYLALNDGQWARIYLPDQPADQTSFTIGAGSDLQMPDWADVREGQPVVAVRCPDCGGALTANKRFTFWSRTLGEPEMRVPFWSTNCGACEHRFNYSPSNGEVRRFDP
jgi:hypothetical protein